MFKDDLIFDFAFDVTTKSSQLTVGLTFSDVIISTWSPLLSIWLNGTSFPLTLAPLVLVPISVWTWKAKSSAVEPLFIDLRSPFGVKT